MYKRQTNYWSVVGLILTLVQAMFLATCASWPAKQLNGDKRCVLGLVEVDCGIGQRLR